MDGFITYAFVCIRMKKNICKCIRECYTLCESKHSHKFIRPIITREPIHTTNVERNKYS